MTGLALIDAVAAVFGTLGVLLAVRPRASRRLMSRRGAPRNAPNAEAGDPQGVEAVLRMFGVMILAFSVVGCAFANLIAYYGSHPPN